MSHDQSHEAQDRASANADEASPHARALGQELCDDLLAYGYEVGKHLRHLLGEKVRTASPTYVQKFSGAWDVLRAGIAAAMGPILLGTPSGEKALRLACGGSAAAVISAVTEHGAAHCEHWFSRSMADDALSRAERLHWLESADLREQFKLAEAAGYRVESGKPKDEELDGRFWWTLSREGWSGVETSQGDWRTEAEAMDDACRAHAAELAEVASG